MLLNTIKKSLRITHDKTDDDLMEMIEACKKDLLRVGVKNVDDKDPLIRQAIKIFVKCQINYEGQAERYEKAYNLLRDSLSMCGDYNV